VAQISLYLEDDTAKKLRSVAESSGEWPESIVRLAGAWKDFPSLDEIRQGQPKDASRELL